jgi:hypothetical protein
MHLLLDMFGAPASKPLLSFLHAVIRLQAAVGNRRYMFGATRLAASVGMGWCVDAGEARLCGRGWWGRRGCCWDVVRDTHEV